MIFKCVGIKTIEISAVNLISLEYSGGIISFSIKNAPLLARLEIAGLYCVCLLSDLGGLLLVHPCQLERLVLDLDQLHATGGCYRSVFQRICRVLQSKVLGIAIETS